MGNSTWQPGCGGRANNPFDANALCTRRYHYFGSLLLLRKLLVIAVSVFLKGSPYQIFAAMFVLIVFLLVLVRGSAQPKRCLAQ